jgi:hypothetical protein
MGGLPERPRHMFGIAQSVLEERGMINVGVQPLPDQHLSYPAW